MDPSFNVQANLGACACMLVHLALRPCTALPRGYRAAALMQRFMPLHRTALPPSGAGCSFSQMCQAMEREGVLTLQRTSHGWEVMGSRLEREARQRRGPPGPPQKRPLPPPSDDDGGRWVMQ